MKAFWMNEYELWRDQFRNEAIAPIQNKVGQFLSSSIIRNVVGQAESTIDIFKIMNEGKIFLVNVSKGRIGEDNSALLGGMIITKIQLAAMERVRIPEDERKDFYLYVDEFQNFATDSFANILSEARKYRLNLIVAHQYTAQLSNENGTKVRDAVFGNVGTMIVFRIGADDAEFIEKEFSPEFTAQDLVNLPNYHVYLKLMIDGVTSRPFSATTLPPIKVSVAESTKDRIIESSRELYTRPRAQVEEKILEWSGMRPRDENEGKFKAICSNCGKETFVPFEPEPGRPIYCKDCLAKIKSGELKMAQQAPIPRPQVKENTVQNKVQSDQKEFTPRPPFREIPNRPAQNPRPERSSGPSPLLKDLLAKIGTDREAEKAEETRLGISEKKAFIPEPVSLSALKPKESTKKHIPIVKDASEESKTSLRDVLSKKNHVYESDPIPKPPVGHGWQKPQNPREVPEDVLKKILGE